MKKHTEEIIGLLKKYEWENLPVYGFFEEFEFFFSDSESFKRSVRKLNQEFNPNYQKKSNSYTELLLKNKELEIQLEELKNGDPEIILENIRLAQQKQKFQDSNRIERKAFRESSRITNAIEEYSLAIQEQNKEFADELSNIVVPKISNINNELVGVINISDIHANELINLPNNKYDFNVLSARLKRFADETIKIFEAQGITTVLLANLGDILNNDKILDKLLNQATNRAKASVLTIHLLTQFILHLRNNFKLNIISVMGNESRMQEKWHSSDSVVSDNYDFSIFAIIKQRFEFAKIDGITFGDIDKMETVVNVNGQFWLFTHDVGKATATQKGVQSKIGSYRLKGINIDFMCSGHIHSTNITDISARSASMAGSNTYNEHALGLTGRSAQNIFIVGKDYRNSIVIDLQNVDMNNCYDVIHELEAYNAKSHEKYNKDTTIFKVVI